MVVAERRRRRCRRRRRRRKREDEVEENEEEVAARGATCSPRALGKKGGKPRLCTGPRGRAMAPHAQESKTHLIAIDGDVGPLRRS